MYCGLLNTTVYGIRIPKINSAAAVVNMHWLCSVLRVKMLEIMNLNGDTWYCISHQKLEQNHVLI